MNDDKLYNSWLTIIETSKIRSKLYETVLETVNNVELVLLNLKIEGTHLESQTRKSNAIGVICDNPEKTIKKLENDAKLIIQCINTI